MNEICNTDEKAIESIKDSIDMFEGKDLTAVVEIDALKTVIAALKSSRKKGKWIKVTYDAKCIDGEHWEKYRCSSCGLLNDKAKNFCCECGSDNR